MNPRNFTPHLILFTMLTYSASVCAALGCGLDVLALHVVLAVIVDVQLDRALRREVV